MEGTDVAGGESTRRSRLARILVALSVGLALGAVATGGYAFAERIPRGRSAEPLSPVTTLLGASLALTLVATALIIVIGVRVVAGRGMPEAAWTLLTAVATITALAYLNSRPSHTAALVAGPFGKPVVTLAQISWAVLALAVFLLLAGMVAAASIPRSSLLDAIRPAAGVIGLMVVAGLVIATGTVFGVTALTYASPHGTTAPSVDVPAVPSTVGEHVAYSVSTRDANWIVPAGPGFVIKGEDAIIAYDGATGAERWRDPFLALGQNCLPTAIRSTGTLVDAVVVVECLNRALRSEHDEFRWNLTAFEAMSGRLLWTRDDVGRLQGRVVVSPDGVPVAHGDDIALLDPITGSTKWQRTINGSGSCWQENHLVDLHESIAYVPTCGGDTLRLFDKATGTERSIDLATGSGVHGTVDWDVVAAESDTLLLHSAQPGNDADALWAVDSASGDFRTVPTRTYVAATPNGAESGQYPGAVVKTGAPWGTRDDYVDLYLVGQQRTVTAPGVHVEHTMMDVLQWALVGDRMVNVSSTFGDSDAKVLTSIAQDGTSTRRPSPCGTTDEGGVLPVPGAILVVCARTSSQGGVTGYDVLGMR